VIEVDEINPSQLQEYLNKGYEFICQIMDSEDGTMEVSEEVPSSRVVTSDTGSGGNYFNHQPVFVRKTYPIPRINTKLLVKRTQAAKLLYEKSLKNENNS
jgi:hypothetical protein